MTWNLFIDDERNPTDVTWGNEAFYQQHPWTVARTMAQVQTLVQEWGFPDFISFDHDLSNNEPTGHDIAKWLVEMDMEGTYRIPDNFNFYVHSKNPRGRENIEGLLNNYLEKRE